MTKSLKETIIDTLSKQQSEVVRESSLSRVWKHATEHETGTISAFRYAENCGEGKVYTKRENLDRSAKLKNLLLKQGYGVTKVAGTYIENYDSDDAKEVKEDSYIVVDLKDTGNLKKDLLRLGELFEQDSITYSLPSGEYYLIGTNKCPNSYPGYHKELKLGKPFFGKSGEFHSKINGRPFVFESEVSQLSTISDYSIGEIRSIKSTEE